MYVIESEFPFAYIGHPKTGTRSTRTALRTKYNLKSFGGQHKVSPEQCKRIRDAGGIVCSTVRNPFDTLVSWYFHQLLNNREINGRSFPVWLADTIDGPMYLDYYDMFYGTQYCNKIIRFEDGLEWQLNYCLTMCRLETVKMGHIGRGKRRPYQEMYTPKEVDLVWNRYRSELIQWGYDYEN